MVLNVHKRTPTIENKAKTKEHLLQINLKQINLKPKNCIVSLPEGYSIESAHKRHDVLINMLPENVKIEFVKTPEVESEYEGNETMISPEILKKKLSPTIYIHMHLNLIYMRTCARRWDEIF